ncbi:MAG: response regulator [Bacteroidota bacterium]
MQSVDLKRVLVVDDEPNILVPIVFLMTQQGYKVEQARNGKEALERMATYQPHLVILDVMMPEMDGLETARHIRHDQRYQDTQIIFLTAKGTEQDKRQGYAIGGEVYLTKPFDNDELVHTVNELLQFG